MGGDVWYFAYGSNLWIDQKEDRTGTVRSGDDRPRVARLANFRLAFNKQGRNGDVYANIMPCPENQVIGIAYRCKPSTIDKMSESEGGYERQTVQVSFDDGSIAVAITFVAQTSMVVQKRRPSDEYLTKILKGARQHGLPNDYIEEIKRIAITSD